MRRPIKAHLVNRSNRPVYRSKPVTHAILNLDLNSNRSNRPVYRYEPVELSFFEFKFEFDRYQPVSGQTGPVYRYRTPAVWPVRSVNETLATTRRTFCVWTISALTAVSNFKRLLRWKLGIIILKKKKEKARNHGRPVLFLVFVFPLWWDIGKFNCGMLLGDTWNVYCKSHLVFLHKLARDM